jgi:hypothetical protein
MVGQVAGSPSDVVAAASWPEVAGAPVGLGREGLGGLHRAGAHAERTVAVVLEAVDLARRPA